MANIGRYRFAMEPGRRPMLFAALLLAALIPLAAQDAAGQAAGQAGSDQDSISFAADRMESVLAKGKEKTILIGSAVVTTGTMEISADRIELGGQDYNDLVCQGNVRIKDESEGFLLTAKSLQYARDTELGLATDGVVLEDSKNEVVLKADWIRFDQKESIVEARIGVHILKTDFAVRSEYARFDRKDESLQLSGAPVAVTPEGTVKADTMSGKPAADALELGGRVSGTITTKKKEGTSP